MTDNKQPQAASNGTRFSKIVNWAACVLFLALLLTPLVLLLTTGEDKTVLDGEKQYAQPEFSVSDFISAEYQANFESWFSTKYPMRGTFVSAYRQLQFDTSNIGFDISSVFVPKTTPAPVETPETTPVDAVDSLENTDETAVVEEEPASPYSDWNSLYAEINTRLYERTPDESVGYKGTDQVVIGKSGYTYENGYINELYGYSQKYRDCPDSHLEDRVEKLSYIQERLAEMGIAFTFIITPSKASEYEQYIPEWYKAQNTAPDGYVRPVTRLIPLLEEAGVNYIHSAAYFDEIGLDETFPLTGIHWNKLAAYEATRLLMQKYEEQKGVTVRNIIADSVTEQKYASGFGNGETDIFDIAYSGLSKKNAVKDDLYYIPNVETENEEGERIDVLIQGGSFCWDFKHYMQNFKLTKQFKQFYYNTWQGNDKQDPLKYGPETWEEVLNRIDYVIFECNEQYVCQMGTTAPSWGAADKAAIDENASDIYASLYNYLKSTEGQ